MKKRMQALVISTLFLGHLGTAVAAGGADAQDQQSGQGATASGGAMGGAAGGFKWPAGAGELKTQQGEIEKWEDGKVQTGGVLGIGGTNLTVTKDTMIVSETGKKLSRKDLQAGKQIAAIYKESDKAEQNTALVVVVGQKAKGGAGAGGQSDQRQSQKSY